MEENISGKKKKREIKTERKKEYLPSCHDN